MTQRAENPFKRSESKPTQSKPPTVISDEAAEEQTDDKENDEQRSSILDGLNKPEVKRNAPKSMREKLANLRKNQKKTSKADERKGKIQSTLNFGKRKHSADEGSEEKRQKKVQIAPKPAGSIDQYAVSDDE